MPLNMYKVNVDVPSRGDRPNGFFLIAKDYDEAVALGQKMCSDNGYRYKDVQFLGDLAELNNMNGERFA